MTQQVLVIHGGNAFDTYDQYFNYLKEWDYSLERARNKGWKDKLQENLDDSFIVYTPSMPNSMNAKYCEWKILFNKIIEQVDDNIILIGHSLGAIFLSKYLSENKCPKKIKATFLVAPPYNTPKVHPLADFNITTSLDGLSKQGGDIFIYHSKDDEIVPFSNCKDYSKLLPEAKIRIFEDRGHFNQSDFPEIIEDIKTL